MSTKKVKTRIQNKYDTVVNWERAKNFVPLKGEIIFSKDCDNEQAAKIAQKAYTNYANLMSLDWVENHRINSKSEVVEEDGYTTTNFIPAKQGDIIKVKGLNFTYDTKCRVYAYTSNKVYVGRTITGVTQKTSPLEGAYSAVSEDNDGIYTYTILTLEDGTQLNIQDYAYIRICGVVANPADDIIITVNEDIPADNGEAFIASNFKVGDGIHCLADLPYINSLNIVPHFDTTTDVLIPFATSNTVTLLYPDNQDTVQLNLPLFSDNLSEAQLKQSVKTPIINKFRVTLTDSFKVNLTVTGPTSNVFDKASDWVGFPADKVLPLVRFDPWLLTSWCTNNVVIDSDNTLTQYTLQEEISSDLNPGRPGITKSEEDSEISTMAKEPELGDGIEAVTSSSIGFLSYQITLPNDKSLNDTFLYDFGIVEIETQLYYDVHLDKVILSIKNNLELGPATL